MTSSNDKSYIVCLSLNIGKNDLIKNIKISGWSLTPNKSVRNQTV